MEFTVRGHPESNKEKLLLILMSRIEFEALSAEGGELHSTFQRLSRLDDEYGTQQVYEWLAASRTATHVYGLNDAPSVANGLDVTVHADDSEPYRRSWVLVFTPRPPTAMLAPSRSSRSRPAATAGVGCGPTTTTA